MSGNLDGSNLMEVIAKVLIVTVIILFLTIAIVMFLQIYTKVFIYRGHRYTPRDQNLNFATESALHRGLDPLVLENIPIVSFNTQDFKGKLECSVCLCEISKGEKTRFLPKCNHGFHAGCIDMWFHSHSTCPLCRNKILSSSDTTLESVDVEVTIDEQSETGEAFLEESDQAVDILEQSFPSASSSTSISRSNGYDGILMIDIPQRIDEEEEEAKTMTPLGRLRSFRKVLTRDRKVCPCSPTCFDGEQETMS